jgi:hypothetical protein
MHSALEKEHHLEKAAPGMIFSSWLSFDNFKKNYRNLCLELSSLELEGNCLRKLCYPLCFSLFSGKK